MFFLPANLMSSTYTDKNNPFSRCTNKHSQLETFSQPCFNRIFSNCLSIIVLPQDWPQRFRSRTTTGSSVLDHDFGHFCRGRRIQMSGHSELGIFLLILEHLPFLPYCISMFRHGPTSTLLRGHLALATLSPPETDPQILERWGYAEVHLGKSFRTKDFVLECMRYVQQLMWISHESRKTSAAPCPGIHNPIVVHLMSCTQQVRGARDSCHGKQQVSPFHRTIHASSTWLLHFGHHPFQTLFYAVHRPGDVHTSTFLQICNHSWSCRTSIQEGATFTEWLVQVPLR